MKKEYQIALRVWPSEPALSNASLNLMCWREHFWSIIEVGFPSRFLAEHWCRGWVKYQPHKYDLADLAVLKVEHWSSELAEIKEISSVPLAYLPEAPLRYVQPCSAEFEAAFQKLIFEHPLGGDGYCGTYGEGWQHLGATGQTHHFRHRWHPLTGEREYVDLEVKAW